jgi:DNA-binding transcriptional LysR family regulator
VELEASPLPSAMIASPRYVRYHGPKTVWESHHATGPLLNIQPENSQSIRDWNDVRFVLAVSATGSFHGAAKVTNSHETTVARRVTRLEVELGTKLFVRNARKMQLTPAGAILVDHAKEIEQVALTLRGDIVGMDSRLMGTVRIAVSDGLGACWLTPVLAEFCRLYPHIHIETFTNGISVGLNEGEADIALTLARPTDPGLAIAKVGDVQYKLCCSSDYLAEHGSPASEQELVDHKLVRLSLYDDDPQFGWWSDIVRQAEIAYFTNSANLYVAAVRSGMGIGLFANYYAKEFPDLTAISMVPGCGAGLWLSSHQETNKCARIRAVIDYLRDQFLNVKGVWLD